MIQDERRIAKIIDITMISKKTSILFVYLKNNRYLCQQFKDLKTYDSNDFC